MKKIFTTVLIAASAFALASAQNPDNEKIQQELLKLNREATDAALRGDKSGFERLLADDFIDTQIDGSVRGKAQTLAVIGLPPAGLKSSYEYSDAKIYVYGDTAVLSFTNRIQNEIDGEKSAVSFRLTNVFARRDGRWQLVAEHSSRLPEPLAPTAPAMPVGWVRTPPGSNAERYLITVDTNVKRRGRASATVKFDCGEAKESWSSLAQIIAADSYRGRRVRLTGWLKTENADSAGLWMRVDGERRMLGFDNMSNRPVKGTTDWRQYEVVLDVSPEAVNLFFGTLFEGKGQIWADDFKLEVVGQDVKTTNILTDEQMRRESSGSAAKKADSKKPFNLDFENGVIP
ncbi:MAG TPA: nuclear transport factor 2 family protein [Pyrinomonadaceae bacterium]|nr:nuclear transport factor 2 family protein [Pyrinomonadaceae bacterium]